MDDMGYKNVSAVYRLAHEGKLLKPRGGQVALDTNALILLTYMAHNAYDWPPNEDMRRKNIACRCYSRGWDNAADDLGMTLVGGEKADKIIHNGGDLDAMMVTRRNTARNRLSQTAKFLQQQGLIKLLIPADVRRERPATWLLLLGDVVENSEVEAYARKCLGV